MLYILVSGSFQIWDSPHKGDVFGQQFDLTDELAASAIVSGAALLPKDKFDALGFNPEEVAANPNAIKRQTASAPFQVKFKKAIAAVSEYRTMLNRQGTAEPPQPVTRAVPAEGKA